MAGVDRSLVAHLFRRAAFGARPAELNYFQTRDYTVAVEQLLSAKPLMGGQPSTREAIDPLYKPSTNLRGRALVPTLNEIQTTWLERMVTASAPLVERMTLFLHDHFATAYRPGDLVDTPELQAQNDLFRLNALGNWQTICHAIVQDVAMSNWLDNAVNIKDHPNENLAREFFELFTLGPGNYTEHDIREAARAFTGYQMTYNLQLTGPRNAMTFNPNLHDDGVKTILGQTGNFMPQDVVNIALSQPAAPRFLARKLLETFVMPTPSSALIDKIAQTLITNGWQLKPALREIFTSAAFTSPAARASIVKSPCEFVVGGLRSLGRTNSDDYQSGLTWMYMAGQVLFDPPNVGGWPVNEGWLGAGGVLARYNSANALADKHIAAFPLSLKGRLRSATSTGWGELFGITELSPATKAALDNYLTAATELVGTTDTNNNIRDAAMITLLVSSPDFSLA